MANLISFPANVVELILEDGDLKNDEAFASITLNPDVAWAKFILTDDKANANGDRIPEEEFENLIKTGVNMPLKMAYGEIKEGHDESFAIGVITHLKKIKNQIVGLAALWRHERPEDIKYLEDRYSKEEPLDLSWEISFQGEALNKDGTRDLIGTSLNATTLVGIPAYEGRLGITALAAKREEEVTKLEERMKDLEVKLADFKDMNFELVKEKEALESSVKELQAEFDLSKVELEELKGYKAEIVAAEEKVEKLQSIKDKFAEAGIEKEDEYFVEKSESLLTMDGDALDFFIQEAVAFASEKKETKEEKASRKKKEDLPNFNDGGEFSDLGPKELAELARETEKKS